LVPFAAMIHCLNAIFVYTDRNVFSGEAACGPDYIFDKLGIGAVTEGYASTATS